MHSNEVKRNGAEKIEDLAASSKLLHNVVNILKECIGRRVFNTQRFKDRLGKFLSMCKGGFWVRDSSKIISLIELLSDNFTRCPSHRTWIIKLLEITRIPPILSTPKDLVTYEDDLKEYFSMFGEVLLWAPDKEVLDMVCAALSSIFLKELPSLACIPKNCCVELVIKSRLPATLVDLMQISDFPEYAKLLVCVEAILQSKDVGRALLKSDILNIMFKNIGAPAIYDESLNLRLFMKPIPAYFQVGLSILWKLGEIISQTSEEELTSLNVYMSDESWRYCHGMFRKLILLRHMRTLRNSYFASIVNIAMYIPHIDWSMLMVATELGTLGTWASNLTFNNEQAEYDFKKMLLVSVRLCVKCPYISKSLVQRDVYQSIFNILTPEVSVIWTKYQRNELMVYALGALSYMVRWHIREFLFNLGPTRLIRVLRNCIDDKLPPTVIAPCLQCIYATLLIEGQTAKRYRKRGGFDTILSLAGIYASALLMTAEAQRIATLCFCILGKIQKRIRFRGTSLDISLSCLNRYLRPFEQDTVLHPNVLIAAIDYLWITVTQYSDAPELFVEMGGIFVLLDVLQKAPLLIKTIILSFVTDLCLYKIALPLLLTWRGHKGATLTEVLLDTFRREGKLIGSAVNEEGVISDLEYPLMGRLQKSQSLRKLHEGLCSSPSILDMCASSRPKIYAVLTILNYHKTPKAKPINQNHAVQLKQLTKIDRMTTCVAMNYFMLKKGECWVELNREFQAEGVFLLAFDQEVVAARTEAYYDLIVMLRKEHWEYDLERETQEIADERLLYRTLRETSRSAYLDCLKELKRISYCSDKRFRIAQKEKQLSEIRRTLRVGCGKDVVFHKTFPYETSVCNVFNQRIDIKSNITLPHTAYPSLVSVMDEENKGELP